MKFLLQWKALGHLALVVAASVSLQAAATDVQRGGTLVAVVQPEPVSLNTALNSMFVNGVVATNVLEGLLNYDKNQKPQPSLATSWTISPDAKTITFNLRKGVKWHDGQPFTSADVKFSALQAWKLLHPIGRNIFADLQDVETPNESTAVFKFSRPSLVVMSYLNSQGSVVLPRHLYEGTDISTNPYNLKPVGTGAFRFKEWKRGELIELVRNDDYWDKGKPYLDRVIFRVIPDATARVAALETGEVLYAPWDAVPFTEVARLGAKKDLSVDFEGYSWQSNYVVLEFNLRNPVLANLQVRRAIAQAINREGLTKTVWHSLGKPSTGPIPSSLKAFYTTDGVPQYKFDAAAANKLLDEAGYPRKEGGVRFKLNFDYAPFNQTFGQHAEYIKQNLKRVGIDVNVRNQDLASYLKRVYSEYDFDIHTTRWAPYIDPQLGGLRHYWSKTISQGTPWVNASSYVNPEIDQIIEEIRFVADPKKRVEGFKQFQRIAQRDIPVLPLYEERNFTVRNAKVQGLSDDADASQASLKGVWIKK